MSYVTSKGLYVLDNGKTDRLPALLNKLFQFGTGITVAANDTPGYLKDLANFTGDGIDDSVAWQAAIDFAQTAGAPPGVAPVLLLPGKHHLATKVVGKSANLIGQMPSTSVRVVWDGADGGTVIEKALDLPGGIFYWEMCGMRFDNGTGSAGRWLNVDITDKELDTFFKLHDLQWVNGGNGGVPVCDLGDHLNGHIERVRWDQPEWYAMRLAPSVNRNKASFLLSKWSYDHAIASSSTPGFMEIDKAVNANSLDLGVLAFEHARMEVNTAWASPNAIFNVKVPNTSPGSRKVGIHWRDISLHANGSPSFINRDTTNTTGSEGWTIDHCRGLGNLGAWTSGTWPGGWADPPLDVNIPHLSWNNADGPADMQSLMDYLGVTEELHMGNPLLKVLGPRIVGWGAPTGTATRTAFGTSTVTLEELAERLKALIDDQMTHGGIGT